MQAILKSFFEPGTWIGALVIAVVAILITPLLPRALKTAVLWIPRRIGRFFVAFWQHFKAMTKAKTDPIAALAYVGRQLALLVMYATLFTVVLGAIGAMQTIDPAWSLRFHAWAVGVLALFALLFAYRGGGIVFLLIFFCEMITNPPPPSDKPILKMGSFELFPPKQPPTAAQAKPTGDTVTYEQPQENGASGSGATPS